MRKLVALAVIVCLLPASLARSAAAHPATRHRIGPLTLRGIARSVRSHDFTLETAHQGRFHVLMSSATGLTEKGKHGRLTVREGDHVGVRGFVQSGTIRAMQVRIYPVKPRAYTIRGTLLSVHGVDLTVNASGKTVRVAITSGTTVHVGNDAGSIRQLTAGEQVQIRVQPAGNRLLAVNVHVYRHESTGRKVELRGTVTSASAGALSLRSGSSTYRVSLNAGTKVYVGSQPSSSHALRTGQAVTVHACCAGGALVASSVHLKTSHVTQRTVLLRGSVASLTDRTVRVNTSHGGVTISLQPSTAYEVGSTHVARSRVQVGDQVSVRAHAAGHTLVAERVHVYAESRQARTVTGVVVAVSRQGVVLADGGKRYLVTIGSRTPIEIDGRAASVSAIHTGDRMRVTGRPHGVSSIVADRVSARSVAPKETTVRGVVTSVSGPTIVLVDDYGARHTVRLRAGAQVRLHGKVAPPGALFPGVRVSARGYPSGGTLMATSVTVSVVDRSVKGRVVAINGSTLTLRLASGETSRIELPAGLAVIDGSARGGRSLVRVGAFVQIDGYLELSGTVRAASAHILHPRVGLVGTVIATAGGVTVRTSQDETYVLRFSSTSRISGGAVDLELRQNEIPVGARVHVEGQVRSDGAVAVTQLVVRLAAVTVRGQIDRAQGNSLTVRVDQIVVQVRAGASTSVLQGSHALALSDLVAGDDVTVYGYNGGKAIVIARKILVHRRLMGLDGTVAALSPDGFVLSASDGDHRVLVSAATIVSGTGVSPGVGDTVHVTGYQRGDGVILATRVRVRRAKTPYGVTSQDERQSIHCGGSELGRDSGRPRELRCSRIAAPSVERVPPTVLAAPAIEGVRVPPVGPAPQVHGLDPCLPSRSPPASIHPASAVRCKSPLHAIPDFSLHLRHALSP